MHDRITEWQARFKAEPTLAGRLRLIARATLVNTDHLAMQRGRPLSPLEVADEYRQRTTRVARETIRYLRKRP